MLLLILSMPSLKNTQSTTRVQTNESERNLFFMKITNPKKEEVLLV